VSARCRLGTCENPLYYFKGARSAPGRGWPPSMRKRRAMAALTVKRRSVRPQLAGHQGTVARRGAGCLPLALRATSAPARTHPRDRSHRLLAQRQRWCAVLQTGHPSGAPS
jgi:hypothetical protein